MDDSLVERRHLAVLVASCALLFLPLAGCYGLWDPWETHYAEIARQILVKHDWISLWWPCSPVDRVEVFHKPVLHFWLMALSMKAFGIAGAGAPSQLVDGFRVEWAVRLPNILLSIAAIASVWRLVRAAAGERVAWIAAAILAGSAQWALVTRQAMTDLPFVAPMTIAMALAGRALLDDGDAEASRGERRGFFVLFALVVVPQLIVFSIQLRLSVRVGSTVIRTIGLVPMLPYLAGFALALKLCARLRSRRQLLVLSAWVWCGLATLAKGPAGLALPGIALALWLLCAGRVRDVWRRLELPRGALVFAVVAFPWYHAMLIRHGMPFWNELIGDNYVHRAMGRHGDRGGWDYYVTWAAYGLFPWTGAIAGAVVASIARLDGKRRALAGFAIVWLLVDYVVLTVVATKFHHYILPALPAVAILGALCLDELPALSGRARALVLLVAAPLTLLIGRDLASFPARVLWLFDYDYVNMPGSGRPWPSPAIYGTRYEYGPALWTLAILATVAVVAIVIRRRWRLLPLTAVALASTLFLVDRMLIALSPHWSQKQVIAAYYAQRASADEALVAWCLYWRGENFYTQNEIWSTEHTVFLPQSQPVEKLHEWLRAHPHRRVFFLVERAKYEHLRSSLPPEMRPTLRITDESNNKLYLTVAQSP
jgi:4-amino-4-deoxy-L-arabinose transferase-like glycosyltransferase